MEEEIQFELNRKPEPEETYQTFMESKPTPEEVAESFIQWRGLEDIFNNNSLKPQPQQ